MKRIRPSGVKAREVTGELKKLVQVQGVTEHTSNTDRMGYFKGDDNLGTVAGAMQLSQSLISHIKISCMYSILINVHEWCMHISCVDYSS